MGLIGVEVNVTDLKNFADNIGKLQGTNRDLFFRLHHGKWLPVCLRL